MGNTFYQDKEETRRGEGFYSNLEPSFKGALEYKSISDEEMSSKTSASLHDIRDTLERLQIYTDDEQATYTRLTKKWAKFQLAILLLVSLNSDGIALTPEEADKISPTPQEEQIRSVPEEEVGLYDLTKKVNIPFGYLTLLTFFGTVAHRSLNEKFKKESQRVEGHISDKSRDVTPTFTEGTQSRPLPLEHLDH